MSQEDVSAKVLTPSTTATTSLLNTLLTSMVMIGLGVIGGFGIFHYSLHHRYVDRMYRTEQTHNRTLAVIRDRYIEADKERKQCIETDDGRQGELSELRGRLEAQYKSWHGLTGTQRSLYGQHQEKVDQLNGMQAQIQRDKQTLNNRQAELEEKDRDLSTIKEEMERNYQIQIEIESELMKMKEVNADQKQDFTIHIEQKDFELSDVMKKSETLYQRKTQLEDEVANMKHSLGNMQTQMKQKDEELSVFRDEEGNLEKKLFNLRTGMLDLLKEKINEIQNLKNQVDELNQEKEVLELKLENWRNGMLDLVRGKMKEIDGLKLDLSESQETIKGMMNEIKSQQIDHAKAEEFMNRKVNEINNQDVNDQEDNELTKAIMNEIEELKAELEDSQVWINNKIIETENLKSEHTGSLELINEKMNEVKDLESELNRQQELEKERILRLESDLTATRETVQTKTREVEQLNSQLSEFVNEINVLKSDLFQSDMRSTGEIMINHVQQRDSVMCRQLFGKGPYYVKFVINQMMTETSQLFFVIEIPSRKVRPHSIYTFLTLVESKLYNDGAAFLSARDGGFQIGSNSHDGGGMTLEQKLKPLGMPDGSALGFQESFTSDNTHCGPYSFGFVHRGPGLNLFLSPTDDDDVECFGQVIRGQEILHNLRSSLLESGNPVEIVSVTHLRVD